VNAVKVLRRVGLVVLIVVVVLACVLGIGAYYAIRRSVPSYTATERIPGLSKNVMVYRDQYGVPQIYAENADDLFRAEGYLAATDRFWEMDFRRHVTAGRLSELFGASQVETDSYIRTMGWRRVAEQELPLLSEQTREYLNAYADGVNAWLKGHSGLAASLEYGVLKLQNRGYKIEPWTPVDSLSWLKAMAWDLRSNMADEIYRAEALASGLSTDQVRELYPDYPAARNPPILSKGALVKGVFQPTATPPVPASGPKQAAGAGGGSDSAEAAAIRSALGGVDLAGLGAGLARIPQLLGDGEGIGSNSWVVSGAHTTTGKPILANDPHLGAAMPSVWWQVGLHCTTPGTACPFDVSGFSFSGVPGVVIGHDARVAWGFTNLGPDVTDLFLERVSGTTYERDGKQVPLVKRVETIKVAGGKDVKLTIRSTVHGPLLSDQDSDLR
jgi:penicillin amidase